VGGDITQTDLPRGQRSGLSDALELVRDIRGIGTVRFTDVDVVRHPLVAALIRAYDGRDRARSERRDAEAETKADRLLPPADDDADRSGTP
jgi:phosphate starvation-inducible PhoH-like protein